MNHVENKLQSDFKDDIFWWLLDWVRRGLLYLTTRECYTFLLDRILSFYSILGRFCRNHCTAVFGVFSWQCLGTRFTINQFSFYYMQRLIRRSFSEWVAIFFNTLSTGVRNVMPPRDRNTSSRPISTKPRWIAVIFNPCITTGIYTLLKACLKS